MFLRSRIAWAGIVCTFLTTGMLIQASPRCAAGSDVNKDEVALVHQNEIKKMQETLRNTGHYRGKLDGVFGLRTRASIRAYQKTENLPVTGELDAQTAVKLGVAPEERGEIASEVSEGKPSAGIRWHKSSDRARKPLRKADKKVTAESDRRDREKALQAQNDNHSQ